jgi:REP element-mobilizing transposase RayT/CheY-like chemotaxis protein
MQQALLETGRYQTELVDNAVDVLSHAQVNQYSVAILDYGDIKDSLTFTRALLAVLPALRIIAFPPHDSPEQAALTELGISDWLSIPFYLPNLLNTLQGIAGDTGENPQDTLGEKPSELPDHGLEKSEATRLAHEWQTDANRLAHFLKRLSLETSAQAALITHGNELWAYAGQLPRPESAAEELARAVRHYSANSDGDLTRFIRLKTTNSDYMLYTTSLGGDFVLALAFETKVSFMEMRTHAWEMAQKLTSPVQDLPNFVNEVAQPADKIVLQQDEEPKKPDSRVPTDDELLAISMDWHSDKDVPEEQQNLLKDLLTAEDIPSDEIREFEQQIFPNETEDAIPNKQGDSVPTSAENSSADELPKELPLSETKTEAAAQVPLAPAEEQPLAPAMATSSERSEEPAQEIDIAKDPTEGLNFDDLEPETASMVNITYTCVLIPRLPEHHLVGDLAEALSRWVYELSIAFGWRLDHLSVRPNYLHWRAISSPDYAPAHIVLDMKKRTSERIFDKYSRFETANPNARFY